MNHCFEYLKVHTRWNKSRSRYASQSMSKTVEQQIGNSTDLNLALVGLLRKSGLEAYPIALSTRNNGFINNYFPSLSSLNYVIAMCVIEGKTYLLDITNDYSEINLLPTRCMNGKGLVLSRDDEVHWVNLVSDKLYKSTESYSLELKADGTYQGTKQSKLSDYAGYFCRNYVSTFESLDKYIEDLEEDCQGLEVIDYAINNIDSLHQSVKEKFDIQINDHATVVNDLILFEPLFYDDFDTNPLKLEDRLYPVEYSYGEMETSIVTVKLPEGYAVESIPESVSISYNEGACSFLYKVQALGGYVKVYKKYKRTQLIFPFTEYQNLKLFYEAIVKKQGETIVLKKI